MCDSWLAATARMQVAGGILRVDMETLVSKNLQAMLPQITDLLLLRMSGQHDEPSMQKLLCE